MALTEPIKRILIVDDELLIRQGLVRALQGSNRETKAVGTGKDALREIRSGSYDLCFLDIHLPDSNGIEIMRKMKKISPRTRIAIISGNIPEEQEKEEISGNAFVFIAKPFDLMQVRKITEKALTR